jgi:AcrR family transcriptional regulator
MSGQVSTLAAQPRRRLAGRQGDTVHRLVDAALVELAAAGYDGLSVRGVARRAGVAPATAYAYFASKDHLVAEVFWRRLQDLPPVTVDGRRSPTARVTAALDDIGRLVAGERELAAAATVAVLARDPDVVPLRDRIGALVQQRLVDALGDDARPDVIAALMLAFAGAALQAGMGYFGYDELARRVADVAALIFGSPA